MIENANPNSTKFRFSREAFMEAVRDKSLDSVQGGTAAEPIPAPESVPESVPYSPPEPAPEPVEKKKKIARKEMTAAQKAEADAADEKKLEERARKLQIELNKVRARRDKAAKTRKANAKAAKIEAIDKAIGGLENRSMAEVEDACKAIGEWSKAHPLTAKPQSDGAGA